MILQAVRANQPKPAVAMPEVPEFAWEGGEVVSHFCKMLEGMGGRSFEVADAAEASAKIAELFADARIVCSAAAEIHGTRYVENVKDPHELADVDVGVVWASLAVAEMGAVWVTEEELVVNALSVLSQHLVVLINPATIVPTMHDAYARIDLARRRYGVFLAGPSATGDIEGVIVHGAQGARSMTVLLMKASESRSRR
jgi:L-lactate dehydrogenase complex protein LldG